MKTEAQLAIDAISVDTGPLTRYLDDFEQRQVPYALSGMLNDIAELHQYRVRERTSNIFTIRRKDFVDRSVKVTKFAKKNDLVSAVAIESPGGGARSDIIGKFENQTQKTPHMGHRSIVVPVDVKRSKADLIQAGNRPKAFNFKLIGGSHAAKATKGMTKRTAGGVLRGALQVFQGEKNTIMIRNAQGAGVILQRTGRGRKHEGLKLLYRLTPKVKLTPDLHFMLIAREAASHAKGFFAARFATAMSTAKR